MLRLNVCVATILALFISPANLKNMEETQDKRGCLKLNEIFAVCDNKYRGYLKMGFEHNFLSFFQRWFSYEVAVWISFWRKNKNISSALLNLKSCYYDVIIILA